MEAEKVKRSICFILNLHAAPDNTSNFVAVCNALRHVSWQLPELSGVSEMITHLIDLEFKDVSIEGDCG